MTQAHPYPSEPPQAKQRLLLLTGLAGAGKSTALDVLEDLGWEVIDNFPVRLLTGLISNGEKHTAPLAVGFDSRTRGFVPQAVLELIDELASREDIALSTLFIDCASSELERRYNETRRRHPMAQDRPLQDGIRAERELLAPLRRRADMLIDTTELNSNDLQSQMREQFGDPSGQPMTLTISSFGFARGMAPLADLVFDMRYLDNPHWVEGLKEKTGLDAEVGEHILADPAFAGTFADISDLVRKLLPLYAAQGRGYVHIAFGCTGGRHRSVFSAEHLAEGLRAHGFSPTVRHRNLGSRVSDAVEGAKP